MNRRLFVRSLILGTGAVALAPLEPIRSYFFAPPQGWKPGLEFHKDALSLAMKDLPLDMTLPDPKTGMQLKVTRKYHTACDEYPVRIDVLYGFATLRPNLIARITEDGLYSAGGVKLADTAKIDSAVIDRMAKDLAARINKDAMEHAYREMKVDQLMGRPEPRRFAV